MKLAVAISDSAVNAMNLLSSVIRREAWHEKCAQPVGSSAGP